MNVKKDAMPMFWSAVASAARHRFGGHRESSIKAVSRCACHHTPKRHKIGRYMNGFYDSLLAAIAEKEPFALGIICSIKGSSPQKKGAKALFFADGRIVGTLGGGCLEAEIRERARLALIKQQPAAFELVLDHDFGWDDGLICGGKVAGLILPNPQQAEALWR